MADVLSESRPRSRGRVRCCVCGLTVPRGARYTRTKFGSNGYSEVWLCCVPCEPVAQYMRAFWRPQVGLTVNMANFWAEETCHGQSTTRDELLAAIRYQWRSYRAPAERYGVSRATLRKHFKPERKTR